MMKKIILFVTLSIVLLMCLTACSGSKDPEQKPTAPEETTIETSTQAPNENPTVTKTVYELLDSLAKQDYSKIEIDVVTQSDFAQLCANYVLTQTDVTYSIEQLNLLPSDGNVENLPENYKTTVTGTALVKDGEIVEFDGDQRIAFPSYNVLKGGFHFDPSNFKDVVVQEDSFSASVISPSRFYGTDIDVEDLRIGVDYSQSAMQRITVTYQTKNAAVETVYTFTK